MPQHIVHPSPHNITTPHWKAHRPLEITQSWITHQHNHNPSTLLHHHFHHPSINESNQPPSTTSVSTHPPAMTPEICCLHPLHRSLSPVEPARPSHTPLLSLDGIFAVAALPNDHPHSMKISVQDRRPPKNLIRSPSLVGKLRGQLRRRATVRSLRAEIVGDCEGDGDARVLA